MRPVCFGVGVLVLVAGCPGDDAEGTATEGESATDTDPSASTPMTMSGSGSASMSGSSMSDGSMSASDSMSTSETSGTTEDPEGTTTMVDPSGADSSSGTTGSADACAGLDRDECNAAEACEPVQCSPYEMSNNGVVPWCLGEAEYVGCRSADADCNMAMTVICMGDDSTVYSCREDCYPADYDECTPPVDDVGGC
jgi:hypothetical protein